MGTGDKPNVERRIDRADADLPFAVYEVDGGRCHGYETLEEAEQSRDDRNFKAGQIGVKSRYEVRRHRRLD